MMKRPRILDCTLRDGSYAINFQFTKEDTNLICRALEEVGFDMIEIGHGMGFGASALGKGVAAESDQSYLEAAAEALTTSDWGMFCIPGIATIEDLSMAADYGMKFLRIGTNVEEYQESKPFIEKAKSLGFFVCSNFMKSYVVDPEKFAFYATEAEKFGSDLMYIVDSAGGMLPSDIERYIHAIRDKSTTLRIGFHGHNNLGLGVANSLKAAELGCEIIDTSLQGFGRSAGNTPTEHLLCALIRCGVDLGIDPVKVMDVAERYIQPLVTQRGLSSVDITAGFAQFHSSYMPIIQKYATEFRVDPRRLIIALCNENKADAPDDLVKSIARSLAEMGTSGNWKPLYQHYVGGEQESE